MKKFIFYFFGVLFALDNAANAKIYEQNIKQRKTNYLNKQNLHKINKFNINIKGDENNIKVDFSTIRSEFQLRHYNQIVNFYKNNKINVKHAYSMLFVAMSFRLTNDIDKSIDILQALVKIPNAKFSEIAKIELANSYYYGKNNVLALSICEELIKNATDISVKKRAIELKNQITTQGAKLLKKRRTFYASAEYNYINDSNPNMSSTMNQVYLYGLPYTNHKLGSDTASKTNLTLGYNYAPKNFGIYGQVSADYTKYSKYKTRDLLYIAAMQGGSYKIGKSTLNLTAFYNNLYVSNDNIKTNKDYMTIYGLSPSYTYDFNKLRLQTVYKFLKRDSKGFADRTSDTHLAMQNITYFITKGTMLTVGGGFGAEKTFNPIYNNNIHLANAMLRQFLPNKIPAYIDFTYSFTNNIYTNYHDLIQAKRNDKNHHYQTSLHYIFRQLFDFHISYSHTQNNSNADIYTFKREQAVAGLKIMI